MKQLIRENKGVIQFIAIFLVSYIVWSVCYAVYLESQLGLDAFSRIITNQSVSLLNVLGYETITEVVDNEKLIKLIVRGRFTSFITEGCNAISIMILFISFVLSFTKQVTPTLIFIAIGLGFIYIVNLFRIVFLTAVLYHYPSYTHLLHGVVFPGFIYGTVFLLWVYWVRSVQKK